MWFCDECGRETEGSDLSSGKPPSCPEHGPRWRLVRNAPCAGALILRDGQILLARRAHEPFAGWWEVPGGFVEVDEHPADAAVREIREELGIDITLTGLVGTYLETSAYGEPLLIIAYEATTDDVEIRPDPAEVAEWRWFAPEETPTDMAGRHRVRVDDWIAGRTVPLPGDGRHDDDVRHDRIPGAGFRPPT